MTPLITTVLLAPFESIVNQCIKQDRVLLTGLCEHSGKTLQIKVTNPVVSFYVHILETGVSLASTNDTYNSNNGSGTENPAPVQGQITGSASAFLSILTTEQAEQPLVNLDLQINGDAEFVQDIYKLFSALDVDWQEPLSALIGDVPVHGIETLITNLLDFGRQTTNAIITNVDEYLHEEGRFAPPLNQVEIFDKALDQLKLQLDRVAARQSELESTLQRLELDNPQ
jgi:ubiquinone biosynthesis protein UbiJ